MNCNELRASLEQLLDGEADIATKDCMLEHIHECIECHSVWAEQQNLKADLRTYQSLILTPPHLREKIRDMLLGHPPRASALKIVPEGRSALTPASNAHPGFHDVDAAKLDSNELHKNSVGDFVDEAPEQLLEGSITAQLLQEDIIEVLSKLSHRERDLMRLRFGLDDGRPRTLEEIAQLYGVTRERIRQIEAKALRKLRSPSKNSNVRKFGE